AALLILRALANILHKTYSLGMFVTHLSHEILASMEKDVRVDGIFATGLDERNELKVDHQPKFNSIGKSTPELIVKKLAAKEKNEAIQKAYKEIANALEYVQTF
ncbi:MAG: endonuclease MutS2, partial [Methanosarcinales archaeon]